MERVYNKLVRDSIPEIIESNGETPVTRILSEADYKNELEKKLLEEYNEVIESTGDDRIEELADMLEIINTLACIEGKSLEDVIACADVKRKKRGGFSKRVFLEKVIDKKEA